MHVGIITTTVPQINEPRLRKRLNAGAGPYRFVKASPLTTIGNPDIDGYGYSDAALLAVIRPHSESFPITVVTTCVPLEDDFFVRRLAGRIIVVTLFETEAILKESGRSPEDYVAITVCAELLAIEFERVSGLHWHELYHEDPRACLFDFAGIKNQKAAKLASCSICTQCLGKLDRANVGSEFKSFATRVLNYIRRPTLKQAVSICVKSNYVGFLFGMIVANALGVGPFLIMADTPLDATQRGFIFGSLALIPGFPVIVLGILWLREVRTRHR